MSSATKPTLYERLGGVYSIAAVVDDFIDRVMNNPILNANPAVDEAHHRVSAAGFKYYVTEMVCWATGGPQNYTGRSMLESHKHLKITESEWDAFCKDFDDTMAKFKVPGAQGVICHRGEHQGRHCALRKPCRRSSSLAPTR
jgi:hemoglobin